MRIKVFIVSLFFACSMLSGMCFAQNKVKVAVIPLIDEVRCKCKGTLSPQGRWCNQDNGTVLDMANCLVWMKKAGLFQNIPWRIDSLCTSDIEVCYNDAHMVAGVLYDGFPFSGLDDDSEKGDWRLPSYSELKNLTYGTEGVRYNSQQFFTGLIAGDYYWSSSSLFPQYDFAYVVIFGAGSVVGYGNRQKDNTGNVWPVRNYKR